MGRVALKQASREVGIFFFPKFNFYKLECTEGALDLLCKWHCVWFLGEGGHPPYDGLLTHGEGQRAARRVQVF